MRGRAEAAAEEALEEALLAQPLHELGRALRLRRFHRRDEPVERGRRGTAIEQRKRIREQDAARGGRRVREHGAVAVPDVKRGARDGLVARERVGTQQPATLADPCAHARGDLTAVERLRALFAEQQQRVGEVGVAKHLALAKDRALRRPQRRALGRRAQEVAEDLRHIGLRGVQHDALAGKLRRRHDELAAAGSCPSASTPHTPPRASRRRRPTQDRCRRPDRRRRRRRPPLRARRRRRPRGRAPRQRSRAAPERLPRPRPSCGRPRRAP